MKHSNLNVYIKTKVLFKSKKRFKLTDTREVQMYMLSHMLRPYTLSLDYETLNCKCVHKTKDFVKVW